VGTPTTTADTLGDAPYLRLNPVTRANRERIYEAQRAGLRGRIVRAWRQSEHRADELLREWESEAATRGLDRSYPQVVG
jgi:hypothetical protein